METAIITAADSGDWIQTFSGKKMFPLNPQPDQISILDIAHALACECRFTGHCREFYSVAQHSVLVSKQVPERDALWGLLHDASEAYLCDFARPLKRHSKLGDLYREAENRLMAVICEVFGLPPTMPESVKIADTRMLLTERDELMPKGEPWKANGLEPYEGLEIVPWEWMEAEIKFLNRYLYLRGVG